MDKQKYYIAEKGKVLEAAEKFRQDSVAWREKAANFLNDLGATSGRLGFSGKFFTLKFKEGFSPENFKKPDALGYQEPYVRNKEWQDKLDAFEAEPQVRNYMKPVINCPEGLKFNNGFTCIGNPFKPYQVCWYSVKSPLLIIIPDVQSALLEYADREIVCNAPLWELPSGMKEILPEEWDFWVAKHKREAA